LFLTVAQVLAVFNISKGLDKDGKEIEPDLGAPTGLGNTTDLRASTDLVSQVPAFECEITPRGKKQVELIKAVELSHPFGKGDGETLEKMGIFSSRSAT
jgi:hypothetical protein